MRHVVYAPRERERARERKRERDRETDGAATSNCNSCASISSCLGAVKRFATILSHWAISAESEWKLLAACNATKAKSANERRVNVAGRAGGG